MDRRAFDGRRRIGTVKAVINSYGERIIENSASLKETLIHDLHNKKKSTSSGRELHKARSDVVRFRDSNQAAESEVSMGKRTVKDIATLIEESNANLEAQVRDAEMIRRKASRGGGGKDSDDDGHQYAEVMRQLDGVRRELSKLKIDMAAVLEEKTRAEKEVEASSSRSRPTHRSLDDLRREIDEVSEEQVLVELAKIEALKERDEIEARKEKEASEFASKLEEKRKKMKEAVEEFDSSKELESKLGVTLSDVNVLRNELELVKQMEKKVQRSDSLEKRDLGLDGSQLLRSITEELDAAKKELALIKEEGFQFMASMDIIRNELKHVAEETALLKKTEEKADIMVPNLNAKLLKGKSKLEAATLAEEKAKSIVSNLSLNLDQLKTQVEVARKEKTLIAQETESIKAEIQKNESEIELADEKLEAAMLELEAIKSSEAIALDSLKTRTQNAMRARASILQHGSTITISKFEHEYLTGRAICAEELADKKVASAQAWIEALKASEKEILLKIEIAQREIRETKAEERQGHRAQVSVPAKRVVERDPGNWKHKSTRDGESRRPRRATARSSPINPRNREKGMPNIVKLFSGKKTSKTQ